MNRFAVVIPYFGMLKPSASLFLESCNRNLDVDFLFFTDCVIPEGIKLNSNIHWHSTTLEAIRILAEEKLKMKIALDRPYKLCDLRAFYGVVFEDYLQGYEYWGYGDTDVVLGRIVHFLEDIDYSQYDKIHRLGHLCFMRNTKRCNRIAFGTEDNKRLAEHVLQSETNKAFDERTFNTVCEKGKLKIYHKKWAADIDIFYWRMRCADKKSFHLLLNMKDIPWAPKNYAKQMFAVIEGVTYRVYLKQGKVYLEEFAYIHFRKEVPIKFEDMRADTYVVTRDGFEKIDVGKDTFKEYNAVLGMINQYNNQETPLQEAWGFLVQWYRKVSGKRGW